MRFLGGKAIGRAFSSSPSGQGRELREEGHEGQPGIVFKKTKFTVQTHLRVKPSP